MFNIELMVLYINNQTVCVCSNSRVVVASIIQVSDALLPTSEPLQSFLVYTMRYVFVLVIPRPGGLTIVPAVQIVRIPQALIHVVSYASYVVGHTVRIPRSRPSGAFVFHAGTQHSRIVVLVSSFVFRRRVSVG